jgi:hypothetical protein
VLPSKSNTINILRNIIIRINIVLRNRSNSLQDIGSIAVSKICTYRYREAILVASFKVEGEGGISLMRHKNTINATHTTISHTRANSLSLERA